MGARAHLEELGELLKLERAAIIALDGAAVAHWTDEKERVMQALVASPDRTDASIRGLLESVIADLRENGLLLVHGRASLREAIAAVWPSAGPGTEPPRRLSIRG